MTNFMNAMNTVLNNEKALTENGAIGYKTSGKHLLDLNFNISSYRHKSDEEIVRDFTTAYTEDPEMAVKFLFYAGDIRCGLGERKFFKACIKKLAEINPKLANLLVGLIPEYTRWDYLVDLIYIDGVKNTVKKIISEQIQSDLNGVAEGKPISLMGKWLPSENTSSRTTVEKAVKLRKLLGISKKNYQKTLSCLRNHLNVIESKMSTGHWDQIDYSAVPSKANLLYKDAFLARDNERRTEYLNKLSEGKAKINASVTYPHEIVNKYKSHYHEIDTTLEECWKALPNEVDNVNTLVIHDGSGSMTWYSLPKSTCLISDVADALAIYYSERNTGAFHNQFITFGKDPRIISLNGLETLSAKYWHVKSNNDCSNTDFEAVFDLILNTAISNHMTQEDLPERLLVISDMEFDGASFNLDKTLFEGIVAKFNKFGYKVPRIVFWNLNAGNAAVPAQFNELGLTLVSGFSVNTLKLVNTREMDPYKALIEMLNSNRYDAITDAFKLATN